MTAKTYREITQIAEECITYFKGKDQRDERRGVYRLWFDITSKHTFKLLTKKNVPAEEISENEKKLYDLTYEPTKEENEEQSEIAQPSF